MVARLLTAGAGAPAAAHLPRTVRVATGQGNGARAFDIEYAWVGVDDARDPRDDGHRDDGRRDGGCRVPLIVFLHEGLGSVSMWRDFPARLCAAIGARGLVYSRPGYGQSTPRPAGEHWGRDFMHRQARDVLPALLAALGIDARRDRPWLLGHSDGGSIALLYAAMTPDATAGLIVAAPHIFVEDICVTRIEQARQAYRHGDLRPRLARHHADPDSAFWGWCDVWLSPDFRAWSIQGDLGAIRCPVLAMQGLQDEYGTLAQIRGIAARVPGARLLEIAHCGHAPHRDQPEAMIAAARAFIRA